MIYKNERQNLIFNKATEWWKKGFLGENNNFGSKNNKLPYYWYLLKNVKILSMSLSWIIQLNVLFTAKYIEFKKNFIPFCEFYYNIIIVYSKTLVYGHPL